MRVGLPSPDTAGSGEWDLDTQSSTGMAQDVQTLYIYATTSLSDSDIANEYSKWVGDDLAQLGNSSFGECEHQAWLDGAMKADDHLFMQAAAQGQTMFVSSGDSSFAGEVAWNARGGGLSQFENSTSWQQGVIPSSTGLAATNLRGLPDIAMAADANSGAYNVYGSNVPGIGDCSNGCGIGGTSEASPLAMGSYARLMSAHGNALGFAAPQLYRNFIQKQASATTVTGPPPTQALGGFHDIIAGGSGIYTALTSDDYTTGLGTLDITVMNGQIVT